MAEHEQPEREYLRLVETDFSDDESIRRHYGDEAVAEIAERRQYTALLYGAMASTRDVGQELAWAIDLILTVIPSHRFMIRAFRDKFSPEEFASPTPPLESAALLLSSGLEAEYFGAARFYDPWCFIIKVQQDFRHAVELAVTHNAYDRQLLQAINGILAMEPAEWYPAPGGTALMDDDDCEVLPIRPGCVVSRRRAPQDDLQGVVTSSLS